MNGLDKLVLESKPDDAHSQSMHVQRGLDEGGIRVVDEDVVERANCLRMPRKWPRHFL